MDALPDRCRRLRRRWAELRYDNQRSQDRTMINPENSTKPCGKCGQFPRVSGQRWCHACRAAYKRVHRHRLTVASSVPQAVPNAKTVMRNTVQFPSPNTVDPATDALAAYRTALVEYERARGLDWKRQRHPPATTLVPLWERIEAAKQRCLALGISPDGKQTPPTPAHQP